MQFFISQPNEAQHLLWTWPVEEVKIFFSSPNEPGGLIEGIREQRINHNDSGDGPQKIISLWHQNKAQNSILLPISRVTDQPGRGRGGQGSAPSGRVWKLPGWSLRMVAKEQTDIEAIQVKVFHWCHHHRSLPLSSSPSPPLSRIPHPIVDERNSVITTNPLPVHSSLFITIVWLSFAFTTPEVARPEVLLQ